MSLSHSALLSSIHSQGSIEEKPAPLSQNFLSIVLPNDHPSTETGSLGSSARFEHIPTEHSEDTVVRVERADSLDNNYSLIRERNSLLTRLEQVILRESSSILEILKVNFEYLYCVAGASTQCISADYFS